MTLAVQRLKPHNESLGSHSEVIIFKNAKRVFQDVLKEASPFTSPHVEYRLVSWGGCPLNKQKKKGGKKAQTSLLISSAWLHSECSKWCVDAFIFNAY